MILFQDYSPYQPSPSPYQSIPSPQSYVPTPSPAGASSYQPSPSPSYAAPSPGIGYSPMTPGSSQSPYHPNAGREHDILGSQDWYSPDIEVRQNQKRDVVTVIKHFVWIRF